MREIDRIPQVVDRPKEMQVLCLGLSRTGTLSMYTALKQLGYTPYHGTALFSKADYDYQKCWQEGLTAKYYKGHSYGLVEFDKLLGNYDAVTDCPCANFPEELIAAYPNAKIILMTRDPDRWIQSMNSCYYQIIDILTWNLLVYLEPSKWGAAREFVKIILMHLTSGDWKNRTALRQGFLAHNNLVRSLATKERFLEFQPEQGWGPLCRFLEKPEPAGPFPKVNEGNTMADIVRESSRRDLLNKLKTVVPVIVTVSVAIIGWIAWRL